MVFATIGLAQVNYVDIEPDVILINDPSSTFIIDNPFGGENIILENNGLFRFEGNTPQPPVRVMPGGNFVDLAECGELIQGSDNWWFAGEEFLMATGDYYVGLIFLDLLDQPHFSWFHFNFNSDSQTLVVLDYAYELSPNTGIMTCDVGDGLELLQEICDNSIDDDLDGDIDHLDSDCPCGNDLLHTNLIVNGDLEMIHSLPSGVSDLDFSLLGLSDFNLGSPDYFRVGSNYADVLPQPHSGFGICGGQWHHNLDLVGSEWGAHYQEPILIDISAPLIGDLNYRFSFFNANLIIQNDLEPCGEGSTPNESILPINEPLTLVLYGHSGNPQLPYEEGFCPLETNDSWIVLGSVQFNYHEDWQESIIEFNCPSSGVQNIALGWPCEVPSSLNVSDLTCKPYFVFDDFSLSLNDTPDSNEIVEITENKSECYSNHYLSISSNFLHQQLIWKFDGVVIENQTSDTLYISELGLSSGVYSVEVLGAVGCAEDEIFIDSFQNIQASFTMSTTPNSTLANFEGIEFGSVINDWQWFFGDGSTADTQFVTHEYLTPGEYEVVLIYTDSFGCTGEVRNWIVISPPLSVYLPNAFSPNQDGINDQWIWETSNVEEIKVRIWDRWGSLIFESLDLNGSWDGSVNNGDHYTMNGVFTYSFLFKNENGHWKEHIGSISVLR
ncbi:MAG: gliding motility-associated C-terminal domain-containing protein [Flavobacteriales bacterium]